MILHLSQPRIRVASLSDAREIAAIYEPFVTKTDVSFETRAPDAKEFERRITDCLAQYPWYVLETQPCGEKSESRLAGYAYASAQGTRAAYAWNAQYSIYLADFARGTGAAQALYQALEKTLKVLGYKTAYALITQPNPASRKFHEKWGFNELALHKNTGYKNGKWIDVLWMYKQLGNYEVPTLPVRAFASLEKDCVGRITAEAILRRG